MGENTDALVRYSHILIDMEIGQEGQFDDLPVNQNKKDPTQKPDEWSQEQYNNDNKRNVIGDRTDTNTLAIEGYSSLVTFSTNTPANHHATIHQARAEDEYNTELSDATTLQDVIGTGPINVQIGAWNNKVFTTISTTPEVKDTANNVTYSYLGWGEWNGGDSFSGDGIVFGGGNITVDKGRYLFGLLTNDYPNHSYINATYGGPVNGDYYAANGTVTKDAITGTVTLNVTANGGNLSGVTGTLNTIHNGSEFATFQFNNPAIIDGTFYEHGTDVTKSSAVVGSGGVHGAFYGSQAKEAGGSWRINKYTGEGASGIFKAQR